MVFERGVPVSDEDIEVARCQLDQVGDSELMAGFERDLARFRRRAGRMTGWQRERARVALLGELRAGFATAPRQRPRPRGRRRRPATRPRSRSRSPGRSDSDDDLADPPRRREVAA
jgi:hypothetical protein